MGRLQEQCPRFTSPRKSYGRHQGFPESTRRTGLAGIRKARFWCSTNESGDLELVLGLARDSRSNGIQASSQTVAGGSCGGCGRNIKGPKIGSAERAGGDILYRHRHDAVNLRIGCNSDDASAKEPAIPEIAVSVDR